MKGKGEEEREKESRICTGNRTERKRKARIYARECIHETERGRKKEKMQKEKERDKIKKLHEIKSAERNKNHER